MARVVGWAVGGAILAAGFITLGLWIADLLDAGRSWVAILVGAAGGALAAALAAAKRGMAAGRPSRSTVVAGVLLLGLVVVGLALWLPGGDDAGTKDTDLGTALLGGAVVAFAVLIVQHRLDADQRGIDEVRGVASEKQRRREEAQKMLATSDDLSGADFAGCNLRDTYMHGKSLTNANLEGCDLRRAVLTDADLTGANLRNANLEGAQAADVVLRGATLEGATLADAGLEGADLRGCDLGKATLTGARLSGAKYGKSGTVKTNWPDGFDVAASGAKPTK
jgi:hypothetical protein